MSTYRTKGSCSREIIYTVNEKGQLADLKFLGGCSGNLQALSRLVVGKNIAEIIPVLKGIQCRNGTSCPDQLSVALAEHLRKTEGTQELLQIKETV